MQIFPWGVRGSFPNTHPDMQKYGGNTTCFEVRQKNCNEYIIIDAGTGMYHLSNTLPEAGVAHVFISHVHIDHIIGLLFFAPFYSPNWVVNLYVPKGNGDFLGKLMDGHFFPVTSENFPCQLSVIELSENNRQLIGDVEIRGLAVPHTCMCNAFRLQSYQGVICIAPDIEVTYENMTEIMPTFAEADLVFIDSQYTEEEYLKCIGWGHTAQNMLPILSKQSGIKKLIMTHHATDRTDHEIDLIVSKLKHNYPDFNFAAAKENTIYDLCCK